MTNASRIVPTTPNPSTRDTAFVVHLMAAGADLAGAATGRVEHVATGRTGRFQSADDLVRFMRDTVAALAADRR
ncbi:hypothetical protein K2Z84_04430 [Candidatus Binatia bacterium]|nr:hypothetical protein [Candidatus Binatia bacterium]